MTKQPIFSLVYTSCRASRILSVVQLWRSQAANPHDIEVVIAVDDGDPHTLAAANSVVGARVFVQPDKPFNCVKGWNLAAAKSTGKVIIGVSDDFVPPAGWDDELLSIDGGAWIDQPTVLHVDDGFVRDICTQAIVTRSRYDQFGYLYYPKYESMFCDTELTYVARRDGVLLAAPRLLFEHMHPDCKKRQRDEHDILHASSARWNYGEQIFKFRQFRDFPLDEGPLARTYAPVTDATRVPMDKFAVYIQATKDDFCLLEVCQRMISEGATTFFFCIPDKYWSGDVTPEEDIQQVKDIAHQLEDLGASNVYIKMFDVTSYTKAGDTRIMVETKVRNATLSWIRKTGYSHILIVDGDELWNPGVMAHVQEVVSSVRPQTVSCQMIPVAGLPGYPISNAADRAVVYIGGGEIFKSCRTPCNAPYMLNGVCVVHFTATRKTMEEIIAKHRASGHYDDPSYDFEGWIANTLPNISPGMRNVHMYTVYQIWPLVRNWQPNELESMPPTILPYLSATVTPPGILRMSGNTPVPQARKVTNFERFTGKKPGSY